MLVVKFRTGSFRVFPYVQVRIRDTLFSQKRKKKDAKHQREPVLSDAHVLEQ